MFRIRPLPALLATFIAASCTDDSNPTAPRTEQRAPKPNLTAYLVTVAGPTVLNVTGGFHTSANGINALGDAVGASLTATGPLLWPSGSNNAIGIGTGGMGNDINLFGQIVGWTASASLWTPTGNGTYQLTTILGQPRIPSSFAVAINDYGQVVGSYRAYPTPGVSVEKCFLWTPVSANATTGTVTTIPDLDGPQCTATDINSAGYVVGVRLSQSNEARAFLWSPTTPNGTTGVVQDLAPNGNPSFAEAINDAGQIVGSRTTWGGVLQGTIWSPNGNGFSSTYLGALTFPSDINNAGFTVGTHSNGPDDANGFFWQNGAFTVLPGTYSNAGATAMTGVSGTVVRVVGSSTPIPPSDPLNSLGQRWDVTVTPLVLVGPLAQLAQAINRLQSDGTLTVRDSRSLVEKVEAVACQLDQGQMIPAHNLINVFVAELNMLVRAQRLTPAQAQPLLDLSESAIAGR